MAFRSSARRRPCFIITTSRRRFRGSIGRKISGMPCGSDCMSKTHAEMVIGNRAHSAALAVAEDAETEGFASQLRRYLSCIRYGDIFVLQGSPLLGAAFAI